MRALTVHQLTTIMAGLLLLAAFGSASSGSTIAPAVVGGDAITTEALMSRFSDQAARRERAYAVQLKRLQVQHEREMDAAKRALLESMMDERLLQLEATASEQSPETLLASVTVPAVSDEDVRAFAARSQPANNGELDPSVEARIRHQLEQQARDSAVRGLYRRLAGHYGARLQLEPRRESVLVEGSPSRGSANARVTIVEFADFQCPFCLRVESTLRRVLDEHPEDVRLVFKELPIPELHPDADRIARGAVCADSQGKFWEFHDAVFNNPGRIDNGRLLRIAREAGLNTIELDACILSDLVDTTLARDLDEANSLAIGGTPALFINGRMLQGAVSYEALSAVINEELLAHPLKDSADVAPGTAQSN